MPPQTLQLIDGPRSPLAPASGLQALQKPAKHHAASTHGLEKLVGRHDGGKKQPTRQQLLAYLQQQQHQNQLQLRQLQLLAAQQHGAAQNLQRSRQPTGPAKTGAHARIQTAPLLTIATSASPDSYEDQPLASQPKHSATRPVPLAADLPHPSRFGKEPLSPLSESPKPVSALTLLLSKPLGTTQSDRAQSRRMQRFLSAPDLSLSHSSSLPQVAKMDLDTFEKYVEPALDGSLRRASIELELEKERERERRDSGHSVSADSSCSSAEDNLVSTSTSTSLGRLETRRSYYGNSVMDPRLRFGAATEERRTCVVKAR
jgi:hypothetical protein